MGKRKKTGISWVLWRSFGTTFLIGAALRLLNDVLLYITPLVSVLGKVTLYVFCTYILYNYIASFDNI